MDRAAARRLGEIDMRTWISQTDEPTGRQTDIGTCAYVHARNENMHAFLHTAVHTHTHTDIELNYRVVHVHRCRRMP